MSDPELVKVATSADATAIACLLTELSSNAPPFTRADLEAMLSDPATTLLSARDEGEIVGIATLVVFRVATGVRAFIDDVVVLDAHRGRGLGEMLVRAAVEQAASLGCARR